MATKPNVTVWGPTIHTYAANDDMKLRAVRDQMMIVTRERKRIEEIAEQFGVQTLDVTPVVPQRGGYEPVRSVQIVLFVEPFEKFRYFPVGGPHELWSALEAVVGMHVELRGRGGFFQADLENNHLEPII
jgi:hypothetical protein